MCPAGVTDKLFFKAAETVANTDEFIISQAGKELSDIPCLIDVVAVRDLFRVMVFGLVVSLTER